MDAFLKDRKVNRSIVFSFGLLITVGAGFFYKTEYYDVARMEKNIERIKEEERMLPV